MIRIVRIGKAPKNPDIENYLKKIKFIEVLTIKDEKGNNTELLKSKEGQKLLNKGVGYVIALSEDGEQLDSISFAQKLKELPEVTFIIGGAFGLSQEVKDKADFLLSLSKMTFPHELAFLMLVEQIYRAERILEGHPYHK